MFLARVIGTVVATQKDRKMRGRKLLLVQPHVVRPESGFPPALVPSGGSVVAVDTVGAGDGELVMVTQGSSARLTDSTSDAPVDAVVIGIVDTIDAEQQIIFQQGKAVERG